MNILVIHGPNLNLLGVREPSVYGTTPLAAINAALEQRAEQLGACVKVVQSNSEGVLVDALHDAMGWANGVIINPASLSGSYTLREAVGAVGIPTLEVHISNIFARERWHAHSVIAPVCHGLLAGLGWHVYLYALDALISGTVT